jgi:2-amino-4-hydroxy-6-hydroxymethyldihydropteridine diphosphokinase
MSERPRRRALLALGSNLGDRAAFLRDAVAAIPDVVDVSFTYETDPVGGPDQQPFLNLVVMLDTDLTPYELLEVCRACEMAAAREREVRWGPRTLDVDVLWVDDETIDDPPELIVPHERMFERAFVLVPVADVAPDVLPDGYDVVVAADTEGVRRLGSLGDVG